MKINTKEKWWALYKDTIKMCMFNDVIYKKFKLWPTKEEEIVEKIENLNNFGFDSPEEIIDILNNIFLYANDFPDYLDKFDWWPNLLVLCESYNKIFSED